MERCGVLLHFRRAVTDRSPFNRNVCEGAGHWGRGSRVGGGSWSLSSRNRAGCDLLLLLRQIAPVASAPDAKRADEALKANSRTASLCERDEQD